MAPPNRTVVLAAVIAVTLTILAIVPSIAGVSTWKWALGVLSVVLFVLAERQKRP